MLCLDAFLEEDFERLDARVRHDFYSFGLVNLNRTNPRAMASRTGTSRMGITIGCLTMTARLEGG